MSNEAPKASEVYDGPEVKGWLRSVCCIPTRLDGRVAIVTGANSGIGKVVTGELARRGCEVIMACRDLGKAQKAKYELLEKYGAENPDSTVIDVVDASMSKNLTPINDNLLQMENLDLSSFDSIHAFAKRIKDARTSLDFLVNNAGIMSPIYEISADGNELQLAVNYLGPVLLTELLLPLLKKAPTARIVNVSSMLHFNGTLYKPSLHLVGNDYGPYVAYSQSKLALTMYTVELAKYLEGTNVIVVSLHPGTVDTKLTKHLETWRDKAIQLFLRPQSIPVWEAAQMIIHALLSRKIISGGYYDHYDRIPPDRLAQTKSEREWLWTKTHDMISMDPELK